MKAVVQTLAIPEGRRIVAVSDVHGHLSLFTRLLEKAARRPGDILIIAGDLCSKGPQNRETLRYIRALTQGPDAYALRGNCDEADPAFSDEENAWLEGLPHIIDAGACVFVHGGLAPGPLEDQDARAVMKNDAFWEKGLSFDRYVVAGHWPTNNYTHRIACYNPVIDHVRRIVSIDGGMIVMKAGQLNTLIIEDGTFSFTAADDLPKRRVSRGQPEGGGTLNPTWNDRFLELIAPGEVYSRYRHLATGKEIEVPNRAVWHDADGTPCDTGYGTDYRLPVCTGETVSVVDDFGDRYLAKKDGVVGWIFEPDPVTPASW